MTRFSFFSLTMVLLVIGIWLSGCNGNDAVSVNDGPAPLQDVISVSPQDGAAGVSTAGSIVMTFNTPMDSISVMEHFHCAGGDQMWEWMDSLQHHGPGPGGHMGDMDHMMDWMTEIEHPGEFEWNDEMTECVFRPDAGFLPNTDYMIYVEDNIRTDDGHMMGIHMQYDGFMTHFQTGP